MEQLNEWEILNAAPSASEADMLEHFTGFVHSFVEKDSRERWLDLLIRRPKRIYRDSHKLYSRLDWTKCSSLGNQNSINLKSKGVYYRFMAEPSILTVAEALIVGPQKDGIFSILAGELAIYFSHEGENVLCKL